MRISSPVCAATNQGAAGQAVNRFEARAYLTATMTRTPVASESVSVIALRWTLGALFIDEFFVNLHDGNYTQAGYVRLIDHYLRTAHAPAFWHPAERFVIHHAQVFSVVQAVGELTLGIALAAGLLRPVAGFASAAWLLSLWLSELGRGWIWEFPPIIIGSAAVMLGNLPWFLAARRWRDRALGPRVAPPPIAAAAAVLAGLALAAFTAAHQDPNVEVWRAGALFTAALLASALLDAVRPAPPVAD